MKTHLIHRWWNKSITTLRSAEILLQNNLFEDSVSCSYYAVLYAARAVLLAQDIRTDSHSATKNQFGKVLVAAGKIEEEYSDIFAREQSQRIRADYLTDETAATPEIASELYADARRFVLRMQRHLTDNQIEVPNRLAD